jgi:hypothetical protein
MSLLPPGGPAALPGGPAAALRLVCTSGRPFGLMRVRVVAEDGADVAPGSGAFLRLPRCLAAHCVAATVASR